MVVLLECLGFGMFEAFEYLSLSDTAQAMEWIIAKLIRMVFTSNEETFNTDIACQIMN